MKSRDFNAGVRSQWCKLRKNFDKAPVPFYFLEGAVKYEVNGKTFYFPIGISNNPVLKSADDVFRTMTAAAWFSNGMQHTIGGATFKLEKAIVPKYSQISTADTQSVD